MYVRSPPPPPTPTSPRQSHTSKVGGGDFLQNMFTEGVFSSLSNAVLGVVYVVGGRGSGCINPLLSKRGGGLEEMGTVEMREVIVVISYKGPGHQRRRLHGKSSSHQSGLSAQSSMCVESRVTNGL